MRLLLLPLGLGLAFSLACAAGKDATTDADIDTEADADTDADTDADSDADADFAIDGGPRGNGYEIECSSSRCTYKVYTTLEAETVELEMGETGVDGGWFELHDGFHHAGEEDGFQAYHLPLDIVDNFEDQRENSTTLLAEEFHGAVTFAFRAEDGNGNDDCVATGDSPSYYSGCRED